MENIKLYGSKNILLKDTKRKRKGEYYKCSSCNYTFYVMPSYLKKNNLNNTTIRYCSNDCYNKEGSNNPMFGRKMSKESLLKLKNNPNRSKFKSGKENPNFLKYGEESNYIGKTINWWRNKLINEIEICEKCGYNDKRALQMHHKDKNTKNNTRENLILLCANCHCIEHFEDKSGIYKFIKYNKIKR